MARAPLGSTPEGKAGRPRIAFMAAFLSDDYAWAIWRGVREIVEGRGGSVVAIAGAGMQDPNTERGARSFTFELVHPANVDGILCLSGVVGHYTGIQGMESWLLKRGLLACSIGPGEHVPNVAIDNASGIKQLVHHLVAHHHHRRIAFIGGTETNADARRRLAAYERALAEHDLPLDSRLVFNGDFSITSGSRAITELFDRRQVPTPEVDAVIAANDYMAFGAMDELKRRRVSVPEQIAVVGFDDIEPARLHEPSLTTVRQPLEQLGREGARRLLDLLAGQTTEGSRTLETELVLRRSCGCLPTDIPAPASESELEDFTLPGRAQLGARLEAALAAELAGTSGTLAHAIEPYLRQAAGGDPRLLERTRYFADELATRVKSANEDLLHQGLNRLARVLHTRMFGPQALLSTTLAELLPEFGLDACAVCELGEGELSAPGSKLKLAFGFDAASLQPQMETFDARELVPERFEGLRSRSVFVVPLTCGPQALGIVVLPASKRDGTFYETLAGFLGTVLKVLELRRRLPARA